MPITPIEPTGGVQAVVVARLEKLLVECLDGYPVTLRDPAVRRDYLRKISALAVVIEHEEEGEVRGALAMYANNLEAGAAFITMVAVDPRHRSKGIGASLLASALEYLSSNGLRRVSLRVMQGSPAIRLYESFGFECVQTTEDDIEMVAPVRR